jgi:excisionase family DNA binding protein
MRLITAREACESLGIRVARLYELVREGTVPCVRLGERQLRFDPEVLAAWSKNGGISNREPGKSEVGHGKS